MCGFIGFTGLPACRSEILSRMAERIVHRGPDSAGFYLSPEDCPLPTALGFRRLSIIDLADGSQPMYNEDGSVTVDFKN
jgi:asparagine synthase (glutamine-hydrolysing)